MTYYQWLTPTFQRYVDDMLPQIIDQSSMQGVLFDLGLNPFNDPNLTLTQGLANTVSSLATQIPNAIAAGLQDALTAFYDAVARDLDKRRVRYFAEKARNSFIPSLAHDVYGTAAKEIILFRDPRDVHASALAFNRKRGFLDFGQESATTDEEWIAIRAYLFGRLVSAKRIRSRVAHWLRYEDLVADPYGTLLAVFTYLGVGADREVIQRILEESEFAGGLSDHRTSSSADDSIGRWRHDLPDHLGALANSLMRNDLQALGYQIA